METKMQRTPKANHQWLGLFNNLPRRFPELAKEIKTGKGTGTIIKIDIFRDTVTVKYPSNEYETLAMIKDKIYKCENDCGHGHLEELNKPPQVGEA